MAKDYTYIVVSDKYFCTSCSLTELVWKFLFKSERYKLKSLGIGFPQIKACLKAILKYRINPGSFTNRRVKLPITGQVCIRVHRGFKIFDLNKLTSTKLFDRDIDPESAESEISAVQNADGLSFAPSLLKTDPEKHWYTESFIPGIQSRKSEHTSPLDLYKETVMHHILQIMQSHPIRETRLGEHATNIYDEITKKLAQAEMEIDTSAAIKGFIEKIYGKLKQCSDERIYLSFTHGDFSFVNFMFDKGHVHVIDWESASYRSVLNDLYNYFFTEYYYQRSRGDIHADIPQAISLLVKQIDKDVAILRGHLTESSDFYRRLYYLERMQMLLDRDVSKTRLKVIHQSIDLFENYESKY